jgi:hypothetical protein
LNSQIEKNVNKKIKKLNSTPLKDARPFDNLGNQHKQE